MHIIIMCEQMKKHIQIFFTPIALNTLLLTSSLKFQLDIDKQRSKIYFRKNFGLLRQKFKHHLEHLHTYVTNAPHVSLYFFINIFFIFFLFLPSVLT